MKSYDQENNRAKHAVLAVNDEQLAEIFKLTIDCFEEVFDYLSLEDLAAMGQTCKRMKQIAGHCFQQNYGATTLYFDTDSFYLNHVKVDCFSNFLQNVKVNGEMFTDDESDDIDAANSPYDLTIDYVTPLKRLTSIKGIKIVNVSLTMARIHEMQVVLNKSERVAIKYCSLDENVLDALIAACSNVKYLSLNLEINENQWMHRIYPALEHIKLNGLNWRETPEFKTFFELNTTIKQFSVDMTIFWSNRELFKNSTIKFDTLAIYYDSDKVEFDLFCRLLNELYEREFYKKMHFYGKRWMHQDINQLASVKDLIRFCDGMNTQCINVGVLRNLEELRVNYSYYTMDMESLSHILPKLKRIVLIQASSDDILPYVRHAQKLNKIKVKCLESGSLFDENEKILDLLVLNKEREELVGACKITIYVEEDVYLATKWAMKQTDFSMIEIKRETSYNWDF
ncbi:uncharacterized protein LOC116347480 [Contarinia nasturtii]|uniref:uncharacterized protein LOC116347480 n=1 Tax=Contarinia nasturtii TaxID=265458 RepID=UPI0012D48526|nr:uncharacterized protein LOC116347480 [Contarinia nasturtii]